VFIWGTKMKSAYFFLGILLVAGFIGSGYSEAAERQIRNKDGFLVIPWEDLTPNEKALELEKDKSDIDYAIKNIATNGNKPFSDADRARFPAWGSSVGYFTYGFVGGLYAGYGDRNKSAEYYYRDYLQARDCARKKKSPGPIPKGCWGGNPEGLYNQLLTIIALYERDGDYKGALPYYKMELESYHLEDVPGNSFEEKIHFLRKRAANDEKVNEWKELGWTTVVDVIDGWENAKKLAKTTRPKPLDPAVQHHKWFYSAKPAEVLRALDYYSKNRVKFMLEKAAAHKNPVVAKKAKEYLDNWDKPVAEDNGGGGPLEKS